MNPILSPIRWSLFWFICFLSFLSNVQQFILYPGKIRTSRADVAIDEAVSFANVPGYENIWKRGLEKGTFLFVYEYLKKTHTVNVFHSVRMNYQEHRWFWRLLTKTDSRGWFVTRIFYERLKNLPCFENFSYIFRILNTESFLRVTPF